jgi:regulator of protease activity HflC (stomatin/prohibitin superfamily)
MAKRFDPADSDPLESVGQNPGESSFAQEQPALEEEPRRAASARFIVDSEVGSEAMLRDAMDPANQSLADALRLSFRVLQAVIVVLIVLFLASGFRTVDDGYGGVKTVWGNITESLSPGPHFSIYPYPIAEFVTFRAENRSVDLGESFTMRSGGRSEQEMVDQTEVSTPLNPGRDGSLVTREGDLAHLDLSAKYEIEEPLNFVHQVKDTALSATGGPAATCDEIVKMALRRAAVHVAGSMTLHEFTDPARQEELKENLRLQAQGVLDAIKSGVRLVDISSITATPPIAIQKVMGTLSEAQVAATEMVVSATRESDQTLQAVAGARYAEVLELIEAYETALDGGQREQADNLLAQINSKLQSDEVTGEVSQILNRAHSYRSQIDATLGNEYRRFASLLPQYRQHPELVVRQQWLDAINKVVTRPDVELVYVPDHLGVFKIMLAGSADVQNLRGDARLVEKQLEAAAKNQPPGARVLHGDEMFINREGRQLRTDPKTGRLVPVGSENN